MAKATGFYCDNCKTFRTTDDTQAPLGWLRLTVRTTSHDPNGGFDLCSDDCVVKFARERVKAAKAEKSTPTTSTAPADDDGMTRVPGLVDTWMRGNPPTNAAFWEQYDDGFEQQAGRGYSYVCDLDEAATASLVNYLDSSAKMIRTQGRALTTNERRVVAAMDEVIERLR